MGSTTPPGRLITHANAITRVTDPVEQQGQHLDWMISELNSQLTLSPTNDTSLRPYDVRLIARGHDGSLLLSCGALASPTLCPFIPATLLVIVIGFSFSPAQDLHSRRQERKDTQIPVETHLHLGHNHEQAF